MSTGTALITVGTTQFDSLIKYADTPPFVEALRGLGYGNIIYQIGNTYSHPDPAASTSPRRASTSESPRKSIRSTMRPT